MRARIVVLPVLVSLAAAGVVAASTPAGAQGAGRAAAAQCTYTPVLQSPIIVNHPTINFHTPVRITGADCTRLFSASVSLAHRTDTYFLAWNQDSKTASDAVYATTVVPGIYRTAADASCSVTDENGNSETCSVGSGETYIKFAGAAHLSAARLTGSATKRKEVRFATWATRYSPVKETYVSTAIAIQRYYSHAWHTIHDAAAHGSRGYTWTYRNPNSGHYRAVVAKTNFTTPAVTGTVTR